VWSATIWCERASSLNATDEVQMDVSFCPHDEPQPGWRRPLQPSRPRPGLPRRVTTDRERFVRCSKGKWGEFTN
jgi:hypothetical protein